VLLSVHFVLVFQLRRPEKKIPIFWWPASVRFNVVDLLMCIAKANCAISTFTVLSGSRGFVLLGIFFSTGLACGSVALPIC
jgi:hypothetical protein